MWEWRTIARSPAVSPAGAPDARSCMTDGDEVQRLAEARAAEAEVGGRDRRGEAVVEALGEAEALVDRVPSEPDRDLVDAQLAGVEEAEQLDPLEVRLAELAELLLAVLLDVPGVVGLLSPRRSQGEQVGGRDEDEAARPEQGLEVLEDRPGVLDVLDRLQEDHGVAGLREGLDQVALVAQVGPHIAQAGMLVGLGVRVDADDRRRAALGHQVRAIALAAGHVDDPPAGGPRRDPFV